MAGDFPATRTEPLNVDLPRDLAKKLTNFVVESDSIQRFQVLAPRGWHCYVIAGNSGVNLMITPNNGDLDRLFKENEAEDIPIRGPAILFQSIYGGGGDRLEYALFATRFFPDMEKDFEGDTFIDHRLLKVFPKIKTDTIQYKCPSLLEFTTPGWHDGLGTSSLRWHFKKSNLPIYGTLSGIDEDNTVFFLFIRLPENLSGLRNPIMADYQTWVPGNN